MPLSDAKLEFLAAPGVAKPRGRECRLKGGATAPVTTVYASFPEQIPGAVETDSFIFYFYLLIFSWLLGSLSWFPRFNLEISWGPFGPVSRAYCILAAE